jgi:hypothetical protein
VPDDAVAGDVYYFGCEVGSHCGAGQKVAITIVDGADGEDGEDEEETATPTASPTASPTGSPTSSDGWSDFSPCSVSCGTGERFRYKTDSGEILVETVACEAGDCGSECAITDVTFGVVAEDLNKPWDVDFHPDPGTHLGDRR